MTSEQEQKALAWCHEWNVKHVTEICHKLFGKPGITAEELKATIYNARSDSGFGCSATNAQIAEGVAAYVASQY